MNCILLRRTTDNAAGQLEALFKSATITTVQGRNTSSQGSVQFSISGNPAKYVFSICNGYVGIWKWINAAFNTTALKKTSTSYGGITKSSGIWYYYNGGYSTSASYSNIYGATVAVLTFSSDYSTSEIDTILSNLSVSRLGYRNNSSTGTVRTNNTANKLYIAAKGLTIDFWAPDSTDTYRKILGSSSGSAGSVSSGYLTLGSVYGGSIIGIS